MPVFGRKPGLLGPLPGIPGSPGLLAEPCCASRNTGPLACLGPDPQSSTSQPIDLPRSKARTRYKVFIVKKSKVFRHNLRVGQVMVRTGTSPGPRPRQGCALGTPDSFRTGAFVELGTPDSFRTGAIDPGGYLSRNKRY